MTAIWGFFGLSVLQTSENEVDRITYSKYYNTM